MKKLSVLQVAVVLFLFVSACDFNTLLFKTKQTPSLGTFKHSSSDLRITVEELQKWDEIASRVVKEHPEKLRGEINRFYAYLYYAQKKFADASFTLTNAYSGSLGPISSSIIRLFFKEYRKTEGDPFSEELSAKLMKDFRKRYQEEKIYSIPLQKKENGWEGKKPFGIHYPTMKPWAMKGPKSVQSPPPPKPNDPFWKDQLEITKKKYEEATSSQKETSLFWQQLKDPGSADWRKIGLNYMNRENIPLQMQLEVRAKLMMGLIDALIAVFSDKYHYMVRRPDMLDPETKTLFKTPNHPSYPAAHGTISATAETILSYYFPENQKEWNRLAYESRESRLWGGIHFPIDLEVGQKQGNQIGKVVIFYNPS